MPQREAAEWQQPHVARGIRTVRWLFAVLVLLAGALAGATGTVGAWHGTAAALIAAPLVALNLWSARPGSRVDEATMRGSGGIALAIDTAVGIAAALLLGTDPASPAWAVLALPIVEGAVRGQLGGALATWAFVGSAEMVRGLVDLGATGMLLPADVSGLRAGVLLALAMAAGLHARNLHGLVLARRDALADQSRRAAALATVATASRRMTSLEDTDVLEACDEAVHALGFDAVEISVADESASRWRVVHRRGVDDVVPPLAPGLAAKFAGTPGGPTVVEGPSEVLPSAAGLGVAVACPVWPGGELVALVVAGRRDPTPVTPQERECLELLAGQAGAALTIADQYGRQRRLGEQLVTQATTDALTGLWNRPHFLERLEEAASGSVAVLFVDLDGFKLVNDRLGHQTGDEVLRVVARRLQRCVRPEDVLARYGGDEFAGLLADVDNLADAVAVAHRMLVVLDEPVTVAGQSLSVTASIGIAAAQPGRVGSEGLLRDADAAMYRAKLEEGSSIALGDTTGGLAVEIDVAGQRLTPDGGR